eukprot:751194-Prorocentrum_minimum.AAC.1
MRAQRPRGALPTYLARGLTRAFARGRTLRPESACYGGVTGVCMLRGCYGSVAWILRGSACYEDVTGVSRGCYG